MEKMRGQLFLPSGEFQLGEIAIEDNIIKEIKLVSEGAISGAVFSKHEHTQKLIPGLVDIHSHGCVSHDTCDATEEELIEMLEFQKSKGVTSYCFTTMTYDEDRLSKICQTISKIDHPVLKGIYLEGPFISKEKKGAQNEKYIMKPDADMVKRLIEASNGLVKVVAVAPEVDGAMDMIAELKNDVRFSLAHTTANYDTAKAAFEAGAKQATHLYNAMPPYNHREPGVIGAVYDSEEVMAELICDGIHVHEAVIRNTFKVLGPERVIMISDSMEATGMGDGTYGLGGQTVHVKGRLATLDDGTIAGSASTLYDCLSHAIRIGVPESYAVWACTRNPAKAIGIYDKVGSIEVGKNADLVLLDV